MNAAAPKPLAIIPKRLIGGLAVKCPHDRMYPVYCADVEEPRHQCDSCGEIFEESELEAEMESVTAQERT